MKASVTFRVEMEDLEKLRYIGEKDTRTVSNLIIVSVQNTIKKYEKKHGDINELIKKEHEKTVEL